MTRNCMLQYRPANLFSPESHYLQTRQLRSSALFAPIDGVNLARQSGPTERMGAADEIWKAAPI